LADERQRGDKQVSAFKVYGVSYESGLKLARKNVSTVIGSYEMTPGQWENACHAYAKAFFEGSKPKSVSKPFDAPQFCRDFIALCDPSEFKYLSIRAYKSTGGKIKKGAKKGQDQYKWLPYDESEIPGIL